MYDMNILQDTTKIKYDVNSKKNLQKLSVTYVVYKHSIFHSLCWL